MYLHYALSLVLFLTLACRFRTLFETFILYLTQCLADLNYFCHEGVRRAFIHSHAYANLSPSSPVMFGMGMGIVFLVLSPMVMAIEQQVTVKLLR